MIKLELENLPTTSQNHRQITELLEKIHRRKQGFYSVIDNQNEIEKIKNFAKEKSTQFSHIVILGIGGSALGPICLSQSLKHLYQNDLQTTKPKLYVLDNIDPVMIEEIQDVIDLPKTLFIVITKSGTTAETLSQYFYFRSKTDAQSLNPKEHFVFITDPEKGLLRGIAQKENITCFEIPENVGGRFSVLTAVGLLPAALIGIDIDKLIGGATKMRDNFLNENQSENLAFQLAQIQYSLGKEGNNINVIMPYSQKLFRLADWYRQLLAESIGKTDKIGLTPVNALGATDQHSQLQLYNDGPNDKLIIFMEVEKLGSEIMIPDCPVEYLKGVSFNKLIATEKRGTQQSLTKNNRPNITIKIDEVCAYTMGELFMFFEGSIAFLGELYEIDAFDQPGVELSKQLTREMLQK